MAIRVGWDRCAAVLAESRLFDVGGPVVVVVADALPESRLFDVGGPVVVVVGDGLPESRLFDVGGPVVGVVDGTGVGSLMPGRLVDGVVPALAAGRTAALGG